MQKKEPFYAAPGADDTFLRPRSGHGYAPRTIAVAEAHGGLWTAWIHRKDEKDVLVASFKQPGRYGRLETADNSPSFFSLPSIRMLSSGEPELICAVAGKDNHWELHIYRRDNGSWFLHECFSIEHGPVYQVDAATGQSGDGVIAYSSITPAGNKVGVYTRFLHNGRWGGEVRHEYGEASVNRPRIVAGGNGVFYLVGDAYADGEFSIIFKELAHNSPCKWETVSSGEGWNMFPSIALAADGSPWIAWLNHMPVKRADLLGFRQSAMVARRLHGRWSLVLNNDEHIAANMNLGLLPLKRYFGYSGLRRYPRLAAQKDGSMALLWEQQRDEEEIWENLDNGFLCARRWLKKEREWGRTIVLHNGGACHAFDSRVLHKTNYINIGVKKLHRKNGNDFVVERTDFLKAVPYMGKKVDAWKDWRDVKAPGPGTSSRISLQDSHDGSLKLFWADLHCHSVFSPDAEGEPDELFFFARDIAGLDVVCLTDNDFYPNKTLLDSELNFQGKLAGRIKSEGNFIPLSGFEWTYHRKDHTFNHRIAILPEKEFICARRNEKQGNSEKVFKKYLSGTGYFNFPHHASWKLLNTPGEKCVEICSAWGPYILDSDTVVKALNKGSRIGFLGNSDSHRFMPGLSGALTGIYARDLTREAIFEALEKRRCFATTGNRTVLQFFVNGIFMGGETSSGDSPIAKWRVIPSKALENIDIIRDGEIVYQTDRESGTWIDTTAGPGKHWYFLQVKERGIYRRYPHNVAPASGNYAWSSPVWVTIKK